MNHMPSRHPVLTRELLTDGYSHNEIARLTRSGSLVQLRRGAYTWMTGEVEASDRHRRLVLATVPMMSPDVVVSHASAAVLHELPVWSEAMASVQVTRALTGGGRRRGPVHLHASSLAPEEVVRLSGVSVTSMARTVVDLSRSLPFDQAVAAGDAALRAGLTGADLAQALDLSARRPGMAGARRTVAFLNRRSESPGESLSRVVLAQAGLPEPELQYEVFGDDGRLVGRVDFGWPAYRTLGEFDGKVKYGKLLTAGQSAADVVYAEKRREDALRDLGWQVVRWSWADLHDVPALLARLERAFRRGGNR